MTTTLSSLDVTTEITTAGGTDVGDESTSRRARWPWFGVVAAAAGLASSMLTISDVDKDVVASGADVLDQLDRGRYHMAFLVGLVGVAMLFVVSSGWKRWADSRVPGDLAARTIGTALGATATINVIFVCLTGSMALYLPGGTDEGWLSRDAMFVNYTLLDFGQLLGWWGSMVAAGCIASLAFRRANVLPRWMGIVSVILMLPAVAMAVGMRLPGFPGLVMPIWLGVVSVGLVASRTARA